MNLSSPDGAAEKKRLHVVAALLGSLRSLRSLLPIMIVATLTQRDESSFNPLVLVLPGILLGLLIGFGSWVRFVYWVENGELRIEKGLLIRSRIFIPADRIQAIDVSAGLLQRAFGLVSVQVKTAAKGTQAELSAVSRADAERLSQALSASNAALPQSVAPASSESQSRDDRAALGYTLSKARLLVAASTSGRLGVLLSGIAWLYSQVDELVNERLAALAAAANVEAFLQSAGTAIVIMLLLGALFLAWVVSIAAEVARFGGFAVQRKGHLIIISRGIFERRELTVNLDKVQAIVIVEGLLRQPLGYATLVVESAGHSEERGQSTQLHPLLRREEIPSFLQAIAPPFAVEPQLMSAPPRALVRFLVRPLLSAGVASLIIFVGLESEAWFYSPVAGAALLLGWLRYRDSAAGTAGRLLAIRRRTLRRSTTIAERRRVQFAQSTQSLFQRRRRLSSLVVGIASGAGKQRHTATELDSDSVRALLDWCVKTSASPEAAEVAKQPFWRE